MTTPGPGPNSPLPKPKAAAQRLKQDAQREAIERHGLAYVRSVRGQTPQQTVESRPQRTLTFGQLCQHSDVLEDADLDLKAGEPVVLGEASVQLRRAAAYVGMLAR